MDEFTFRRAEILALCQRITKELSPTESDAVREAVRRIRTGEAGGTPKMPARASRFGEMLLGHLQDADAELTAEQVAELEALVQEQLPNP